MPKNDEFNSVNVNNEGRNPSFEFGNIQRNEFSSYKENKSVVSRDELNNVDNKNNENVKTEGAQTNNNDVVKKVVQTTTTAEGVTTTTGIASTAASTSATVGHVVVGATVVAVTAVATVAGINVLSKNNASVNIEDISIGETSLVYYLELKDSEDDPFSIVVENDTYTSSRNLLEGFNEGSFEDLVNHTRYRLYIQEQNENKKIIYDTYFVTGENIEPSELYFVSLNNANFYTYTFDVNLSYFDERDVLSDFKLTVTDANDSSRSKVFELEKTRNPQTVNCFDDEEHLILDIRNSTFNYRLDYLNNGKEEYLESDFPITFEDTSGKQSEYRGTSISDYANFDTFMFGVTLSLVDDFDYYDTFTILMTNVKEEPAENQYPVTLELEETDDEQFFDYQMLNPEEPDLLATKEFIFVLTYNYKGEQQQEDLGQKAFINNAGYMNEPIIDPNADFANLSFDVTLNYTDEYNQIDDSLSLKMVSRNDLVEYFIPLVKTDQPQKIFYGDYNEANPYIFRLDVFDFALIYSQNGKPMDDILLDDISFSDAEGREPSITLENIDYAHFNYLDYSFNATFTVSNPFNNITNAELILIGSSKTIPFEIDLIDGVQTFSCLDEDGMYLFDMASESFTYTLVYYVDGNLNQFYGEDSFQFYNYDYSPVMQSGTVYELANYPHNSLYVKYTYCDIYDEAFNNFRFRITKGEETPSTISVSKTRAKQEVSINREDINLADGPFLVELLYYDVSQGEDKILLSNEMYFEDEYESSYDPTKVFSYDFTVFKLGEGSDAHYYLPFAMNYSDPEEIYHGFTLSIGGLELEIMAQVGWQIIDVTDMCPSLLEDEITLELSCEIYDYVTGTTTPTSLASKSGTITLQETPKAYGASVPEAVMTMADLNLQIRLCIFDLDEQFRNYQLILETSDNTRYTFDVDVSGVDRMYEGDVYVMMGDGPEYEDILKAVDHHPVNLYLVYEDSLSGESYEIQFAEAIYFTLIA